MWLFSHRLIQRECLSVWLLPFTYWKPIKRIAAIVPRSGLLSSESVGFRILIIRLLIKLLMKTVEVWQCSLPGLFFQRLSAPSCNRAFRLVSLFWLIFTVEITLSYGAKCERALCFECSEEQLDSGIHLAEPQGFAPFVVLSNYWKPRGPGATTAREATVPLKTTKAAPEEVSVAVISELEIIFNWK